MTHVPTCRCIWCASDPDSECHDLTIMSVPIWHTTPLECPHKNDHFCPTCRTKTDFDPSELFGIYGVMRKSK